MMIKINELADYINNGNLLGVGIIIFFWLIVNLKNIIEFIDFRKKIKISKLEEALKNENIKGLDRELLENELTKEYFKITMGINVEKEFREAIINVFKKTKGELMFKHFQRALYFMEYENDVLILNISTFDRIAYYYNIFSGILLTMLGVILFSYGVFTFSLSYFIPVFGTSCLLVILGLFAVYETRHLVSGRKVLKELEKQKKQMKEEVND